MSKRNKFANADEFDEALEPSVLAKDFDKTEALGKPDYFAPKKTKSETTFGNMFATPKPVTPVIATEPKKEEVKEVKAEEIKTEEVKKVEPKKVEKAEPKKRTGRVIGYVAGNTIVETPKGNVSVPGHIGKKGRMVEY